MTRAEMAAKLRDLADNGIAPGFYSVKDSIRAIADALEQEQRELVRVRDEMEKLIVLPDEMSYHGELLVCVLCGNQGTRAGFKRDTGNSPVKHDASCAFDALTKVIGEP